MAKEIVNQVQEAQRVPGRIIPSRSTQRKTCGHFLKSRCISELSWKFLKNTNVQLLPFFLQSSRYISSEQPWLKTELYDDLLLLSSLFHFFLFHIQCSHFIQFMFSIFSISFCFLMFFLKSFKHSRKALTNLDSQLKSRNVTLQTKYRKSYSFSSSHIQM